MTNLIYFFVILLRIFRVKFTRLALIFFFLIRWGGGRPHKPPPSGYASAIVYSK